MNKFHRAALILVSGLIATTGITIFWSIVVGLVIEAKLQHAMGMNSLFMMLGSLWGGGLGFWLGRMRAGPPPAQAYAVHLACPAGGQQPNPRPRAADEETDEDGGEGFLPEPDWRGEKDEDSST